jgi:class 3 adenylate cyclase
MLFDKRGTALSDRPTSVATLEEQVDDIQAVMDAVGSSRAVLLGLSEGATMSILHAAAHPDRTAGLVLCGGLARYLRAPDYPWGQTREQAFQSLETIPDIWGTAKDVRDFASRLGPSRAGDERFVEWVGRLTRFTAPPGWGAELEKMLTEVDIRAILPVIQTPALILHSLGDQVVEIGHGRYLAEHIARSRMVELPGSDHLFWFHPEDRVTGIREIRRFVQEIEPPTAFERVLATVVFTDIVGSTRHASELGDQTWAQLLGQHFRVAREALARFRGREVKATGDGLLATFDGPTRALMFADALRAGSRRLGLQVRVGMHTGECAPKDGDVQGIAVHIAARVAEKAREGEILVSGTVRDLSVGSGLKFTPRGASLFKGVPDRWRLFALDQRSAPASDGESGNDPWGSPPVTRNEPRRVRRRSSSESRSRPGPKRGPPAR